MEPSLIYAFIAIIVITVIIVPVLCVMLYIFGFYVYVTSFFIRNEEKERKRRRHERKARYRQPEAVVVGSESQKPSKESLEKRSSGDSGSDRNKSTVEQYMNESINHQMSESSEKISRKVPTNKAAKKGDQIYRPSNERQTVKNSRVSQVRKEDESQSDSSDTDDTTPKKLKKKEAESSTSYKPYANEVGVNIEE